MNADTWLGKGTIRSSPENIYAKAPDCLSSLVGSKNSLSRWKPLGERHLCVGGGSEDYKKKTYVSSDYEHYLIRREWSQ